MKKVADFKTYQNVQKMSFNDFNRWVTSIYRSGMADGLEQYGENPIVLDEDELRRRVRKVVSGYLADRVVEAVTHD